MVWVPPDAVSIERERIAELLARRWAPVEKTPSPPPIVLRSSRSDQSAYEGYTLPGTAATLQAAAEAAGWGVTVTWATAILPPGFQRTDRSKPIPQAIMIDSVAIRLVAMRVAAWAVWTLGISDPPIAGIAGAGIGLRSIGVKALLAYVKGEFDGDWV